MPMQADTSELAGVVVEAVLYGILVVLTIGTLYVLLRKNRRASSLNIPMIITSILMWSLATVQLAVDCKTVFEVFLPNDRAGRVFALAHSSKEINALKRALFFTMMILGDAIVIYRSWIVWNRKWWIVVLPSLCSLASAVMSYMAIWAVLHPKEGAFILRAPWTFGTGTLILSLCANLLAVGAIAWVILEAEMMLKRDPDISTGSRSSYGRTSLLPIVRIVIESGVLNAAYLSAYLAVLYVYKGRGPLPLIADIASPTVGIIFSLVIVRAGIQQAQHNEHGSSITQQAGGSSRPVHDSGSGRGRNHQGTTIDIEIAQANQSSADSEYSENKYVMGYRP